MLKTSPADTLALDVLHTVHLGVAQRLGSVVFWRVLEANVARKRALPQRVKSLESLLHTWYQTKDIPHESRLGRLTLGMIGGGMKVRRGRSAPHPGVPMKIKGAEMAALLPFCKYLLELYFERVRFAGDLLSSVDAMLRWID
eukprot:7377198-Pyramimonas_sp.AAC.1